MLSTGKIFAILFGMLLLFTSIGFIIGGGALIAISEGATDEDGYINSSEIGLDGLNDQSVAIVVDSIKIEKDQHGSKSSSFGFNPGSFVQFRLHLANNDGTYFAGIAEVEAVQEYLTNVSYQRVSNIADTQSHQDFEFDDELSFNFPAFLEIEFQSVNFQSNQTLEDNSPLDQDFWIEATTDTELQWKPTYGEFALVIMKTDGSPNVDTDVSIGMRIPILTPIGGMLLFVGLVLMGTSVLLFYVGFRNNNSKAANIYVPVNSDKSVSIPSSDNIPKSEVFRTSETKYCKQCGDEVDFDAQFCSACGHKVNNH